MKRKSILAAFSAFIITAGVSAQSYDVKAEIRKPTFIYGIGLSEKDVERTAELLEIESLDGINVSSISGAELDRFLNEGNGNTKDSEMISSVAVVQEKPGSGIEVAIATPENITLVSELQYENACLTAGIKDVYAAVGAVSEVTGESARAGIYKVFKINSETLEPEEWKLQKKR